SATLDGQTVPVRPAQVAFRAVFVPAGRHTVVFSYRPAGFLTGLGITAIGGLLLLALLVVPATRVALRRTHDPTGWPDSWPWWALALAAAIVASSAIGISEGGGIAVHSRWNYSRNPDRRVHRFTCGAGIGGMGPRPGPADGPG